MGSKTTPDLSEFYRLSQPKRKPCQLRFILEQLPVDERAQLKTALATDVGIITAAAVVQWLGARGHEVTFAKVTSHRNRKCDCDD